MTFGFLGRDGKLLAYSSVLSSESETQTFFYSDILGSFPLFSVGNDCGVFKNMVLLAGVYLIICRYFCFLEFPDPRCRTKKKGDERMFDYFREVGERSPFLSLIPLEYSTDEPI